MIKYFSLPSLPNLKEKLIEIFKPILSMLIGLSLGLLATKCAGENPWRVLEILVKSAFGSRYDLGMTLFYSTPLIFTGLSVTFALHAGLFNIGAEGQLAMGALATAAVGICFPHLPSPWAPILGCLAAIIGGAAWGAIPGWLRAKRGSHEVINTIMLNFISAGLCSWVTLYLLRNRNTQNPETETVGQGYFIHHFDFFGEAPVSIAIIIALLAAVFVWFILWKTAIGYEIRAVGQNEQAARAAGIDSAKIRILAMTIAGGLAGLVGVNEVLGNSGRFKIDFSPGYGFMGIAVALLGRNRPLGVIASAILFGALHKGSTDLDLETENVTRDFSLILQALVILCVSADGFWSVFRNSFQYLKGMKERRKSVTL
jgi:simple sugar transport system permease protein